MFLFDVGLIHTNSVKYNGEKHEGFRYKNAFSSQLKLWFHFIYIFTFSGPDSPYTKTALEIVNVCKQTLAEVCLCASEPALCCFHVRCLTCV